MQIAELGSEIAKVFDLTPDAWRVRQQMLQRAGALKGWRGGGEEALLATASASAMLVLMGMIGKNATLTTIAPAVVRMWEAAPVTRSGNPLEKCDSAGAVLTLLLQRADVRSRLAYVELDHDVPELAVVLDRGSRASWAPYTPKEWRRRVADLAEAGLLMRVSRLPRATFDKVAALIEQEAAA